MPTAVHLSLRPHCTALGLALGLACLAPSAAAAPPLTESELTVIEERLAPLVPTRATLKLPAGGTVLVEDRVRVPAKRLPGPDTDYEGVMTDIRVVPGSSVHQRIDSLRFTRRGPEVEVVFVYAVAVEPTARRGGRVRATFALRERKGLANTVVSKKVRHRVVVTPPNPSVRDLAADFRGYRYLLPRAKARMRALSRAGLRGLTLQDEGTIRGTQRLNPAGVQQLRAFEQERRRMWIAHRHLRGAAEAAPEPEVKEAASVLLANLGTPESRLSGLPPLALVEPSTPSPPPPPPPTEPTEPTEAEPSDTLEPVAEYVAGSEGTVDTDPVLEPEPVPEPPPEPEPEPVTAPSGPRYQRGDPETDPKLLAISIGLEEVPADPGDADRLVRRYYLPSYPRGLVLDDPNIGHGAGVRASYAEVTRPESAQTLAVFYSLQAGLTPDLGLEVHVPTQLVSLDIGGLEQSLYRPGNPLLSAKYRLHLPTIQGRRPTLTLRARWGMAIFQRHQIPASDLDTEQFSRVPNMADTYAFLPERTDLGIGVNAAWQKDWLVFGAQLYFDYFIPSEIAPEQDDFLAIGYAASIGAVPFGDVVGGFLEARGVSFVAGPQRTEAFLYAGVRSRLFDLFEPALWVGLPVGSVAETSSAQLGLELQVRYDVRSIVQLGGRKRDRAGDLP